uniref:Uncharacterized protein n=1 Tax=Triticum urartu TaxID=4572 RepID=A0A8R7QHT2_TRIUA
EQFPWRFAAGSVFVALVIASAALANAPACARPLARLRTMRGVTIKALKQENKEQMYTFFCS